MDQQLEKKFLAHVIKNPGSVAEVKTKGITEEYFQYKAAGKLYSLNTWYVEHYNTPLTEASLVSLLKQSKNLPEELQSSILVLFNEVQLELLDSDVYFLSDQFTQYYKQHLIELAIRHAAETLAGKKTDEAIIYLKNALAKVDEKFRSEIIRSGQLDQFAPEIHWEYNDRKANPSKYEGIMTGYKDIDNITGGLVKSSVSLIMAPPKGFKSALAMNICYNAAKRGVYSYYHANEGTYKLFYGRFAAMELCIPYKHIKDNTMDAMEESRWINWIQCVESGQHPILKYIYFDEVPPAVSTPDLISERLKKLKADGKNVGLVIIDHFGRMTTTTKEAMQDWQMKGAIAQQICSLALEHRTPFILLTHVKSSSAKEGLDNNKDFDAYDIERSGQPLKDVDYVFSWKIENEEEFLRNGSKGFARLALTMSRHSETGVATLLINGRYMQITELQIGGTGAAVTTP